MFLGSGFSVLAKDSQGRFLPTGPQLLSELVTTFSVPNESTFALPQICTIIESTRKSELREYLKDRFFVSDFDDRYAVLPKMEIKTIFTTNIDNLLYLVFSGSDRSYLNDIDQRGPSFSDRRAIDIITLHGSVLDDLRPFRFGTEALATAFASDPDRWHFLSGRLQQHSTLFWGYSVGDAGTLQALSPETSRGRQHKDSWIILHPSAANDGNVSYFRALGFQLIKADTAEMLDYLASVATKPMPTAPEHKFKTRDFFPGESVPEVGTVPVRPIMEFYLGAAPQWSDIMSGNLFRTLHFRRLRDSINSKKNSLIIGVPACGKTTVLMQLAMEDFPETHKLVVNSLTLEKARFIENKLGGEPTLIFVDNFTDSWEAVEHLSMVPNIQLVGADRDYNFGIIDHKIDRDKFNIVDVTELSDSDIQGCLQTIPHSIRTAGYTRPHTNRGLEPSIFELIEANVAGPSLRERFASVLSQLEKVDPRLRDLLVMISYVKKSRVPVSMDMMIAYLRDYTTDYKRIYSMREKLGSMIAEYGGDLGLDGEQDYFVPRSNIVGEAILDNAKGRDLREMLLRFHKNVSPYRICRYDVFAREAYDNRLAYKAFPDWKEGKKFYEDLYFRDQSPYTLQHCALYLSGKGQYSEAFEMIDRAITVSGGRIWSIRNSHAIILFKANISHYDKPIARETLNQSMEILTYCYEWDKRKPFHALTFADQALQYWKVYKDERAKEYLKTAALWLGDEAQRSPWNRQIRRLLPAVKRKLDQ